MKIVFDGLCISGQLSGVQHYARHIIGQARRDSGQHEFIPIVPERAASVLGSETAMMRTVPVNNRIERIWFEHTSLGRLYRNENADLLHCPSYILPWNFRGHSVVTVHDTIALDYPQYCKPTNALYFNLLLKRSIRNATRIIAVSERVKKDILRLCRVPDEKISVIYHGVEEDFIPQRGVEAEFVRQKWGLPRQYILFVGNIEPKKNLDTLVRAFAILRPKLPEGYKLVIAGQWGWKYDSLLSTIERAGVREHVVLTGYIPACDLPAVYSLAELFVFPSLYEGFGIPPLEAMACGTPVLLSPGGALQEIYPDFCAFADPRSPSEWAVRMEACLTGSGWRARCRQQGLAYAGRFTWERAWEQTLRIYTAIV